MSRQRPAPAAPTQRSRQTAPRPRPVPSRRRTRRQIFDTLAALARDPVAAASGAGLRYVTDLAPGITRHRAGAGFRYLGPDGTPLRDKATLARIRALAIPPAWTEVWISPSASGHLQATGRDARGRKQYRYHPRWREVRDATKFARLARFAELLPRLRRRVATDLAASGFSRERVLAAVVRLLETTLIRVGNEEYARTNNSFGLTTLRNRHVEVTGQELRFHFRGKSGIEHRVDLRDRRLAAIVRRCQELPGQDLFQYPDETGQLHRVTSDDVNAYIRETLGEDFSAKDFRTWAGTVLAARTLRRLEPAATASEANRQVVAAVDAVAHRLGNTRAVCRRCYIHPAVIDAYLAGTLAPALDRPAAGDDEHALSPDESALLALLRRAAEAEAIAGVA